MNSKDKTTDIPSSTKGPDVAAKNARQRGSRGGRNRRQPDKKPDEERDQARESNHAAESVEIDKMKYANKHGKKPTALKPKQAQQVLPTLTFNPTFRPVAVPVGSRAIGFSFQESFNQMRQAQGSIFVDNEASQAAYRAGYRLALLHFTARVMFSQHELTVRPFELHPAVRTPNEVVCGSTVTAKVPMFTVVAAILSSVGRFDHLGVSYLPVLVETYIIPAYKLCLDGKETVVTRMPRASEINIANLRRVVVALTLAAFSAPWRRHIRDNCPIPGIRWQEDDTIAIETANSICPQGYGVELQARDFAMWSTFMSRAASGRLKHLYAYSTATGVGDVSQLVARRPGQRIRIEEVNGSFVIVEDDESRFSHTVKMDPQQEYNGIIGLYLELEDHAVYRPFQWMARECAIMYNAAIAPLYGKEV